MFRFVIMSIKNVLSEELKKISLSEDKIISLEKIAKDFIRLLKKNKLRAYIGGSLAKNTLIVKDKQDVDIFVVFDYSEDIFGLEKILKKIKLPGKLERVHGSRDYFHIDCGDVLLEVIPVVKNKDPELAENVTDVSLSHVKYVVEEIKKNPKLSDEIKLAKAFCRANRCYGAEGYIRGFSGYSLEILVIYFKGFVKFLKGIQKKAVVDPLKYFKSEREVMMELNGAKLQGPLVVVDPTYKYRNVCAGLGIEAFERLKNVARDFLKSPGLEFFDKKEIDVKVFRALAVGSRRFVEVDLSTDRQVGDIAGTKMKKILDFFVRELERKGQKILRKEFDYDGVGSRAKGYLVVERHKEIDVRGPSIGLQDAVLAFRKAKGERAFIKKGFWWFRETVSIEGVLDGVKKIEGEMGASISLK